MHTKTTRIVLASILITGFLAAFPVEPFDMHSNIGHMVEEKIAEMNKQSGDDLGNLGYPDLANAKEPSSGTSNDVDSPNTQDCR